MHIYVYKNLIKHLQHFFKKLTIELAGNHSVHHPFLLGGGVEPPTKFSNKGEGLTGPQLLEGACWERGGDFFLGGWNFHTQKIKVYRRKNIFPVITKNSNKEILTKNLVTFKR